MLRIAAVALAAIVGAPALHGGALAAPQAEPSNASAEQVRHAYEFAIEQVAAWHGYGDEGSDALQRLRGRVPGDGPRSVAYRHLLAAQIASRRYQFGLQSGGRADAWSLARDALGVDGTLAEAHAFLGRLELERGCAVCAGTRADQARKLDPAMPEAALLKAFPAIAIGDHPSAGRWLREAVKLARERWPVKHRDTVFGTSRRVDLLVDAANRAAEWKQPADAEAFFAEALEVADAGGRPVALLREREGWVRVRYAHYLLFAAGAAPKALREADTASRLTADPEARMLKDLARYAECASTPRPARAECLAGAAAAVRLPPQDAFAMLARSPRTIDASLALLESGVVRDPNAKDRKGRTALLHAAAGDNLDGVKRLVAVGANVNARDLAGVSALRLFSLAGNGEAVRYLLSAGARIDDADEATALMIVAVQRGNVELLRLVLDQTRGAKPDLNGVLRAAAMSGRVEPARLLLERGASASARDWSGASALDYARAAGNREMIRLFESRTGVSA